MPDTVQKALTKALQQLRTQRSAIDRRITALETIVTAGRSASRPGRRAAKTRKKRKMSASQRQAVSRRMKAYWAKRRAK